MQEMQQELLKCKCQLEDVEKKLRCSMIDQYLIMLPTLLYFMNWDVLMIVKT